MSKYIWKYDLIFENCDCIEIHRTKVKSVSFGKITRTVFSANSGELLVILDEAEMLEMVIDNSVLEKEGTFGVSLLKNIKLCHLTHVRIWLGDDTGITYSVPWGDVDSFYNPNPYESHVVGEKETTIAIDAGNAQ